MVDDERIAHDLTIAWVYKYGKRGNGIYEFTDEYFDTLKDIKEVLKIKRDAQNRASQFSGK